MDIATLSIILLVVLFGLLLLGLWVGFALLAVGIVAMELATGAPTGSILATKIWGSLNVWDLTALPMFIWMGEILFRSRLSSDLFTGLSPFTRRLPGGLLHVNILGCALFAAVSGSSAATTATVGRMSLPELKSRGYDMRMAIGTLAGSGTFGFLIPPSIILIVYGAATEQSIARLFLAGLLPGLMLAAMFAGYVMLWSLMHPDRVPAPEPRPTLRQRARALKLLLPTVLLIVAVIGSIYAGLASPTEAAVVGVAGALAISGLTGGLDRDSFDRRAARGRDHHLHDRLHPGGRVVPDRRHGVHRHPAHAGRVDRRAGLFAIRASVGTAGVLHRARVLPRRDLDRGADHLGDPADGDGCGDRSDLVRHIPRARRRDEPDHAAGGVQPFVLQSITGRGIFEIALMALPFFLILVLATAVLSVFPEIALWLPGTMMSR